MATSDFVVTTVQELHERIDDAYGRFARLAAEVPDELDVGTWTSRLVVAHLVTVVNRYNEFDPERLAGEPRGVDEINEREVQALGEASSADLLARLDEEMGGFRTRWGATADLPLDLPLPFHGGATIDVQSGLTNLIGEFLMHGRDVASRAGRPWPIADRDGVLLAAFATQILPFYVSRANTDDLVLHLDLDGMAPWVLEVHGATATARPAPAVADVEADVLLRGSPVPVPLLFYGRIAPSDLAAHGLDVVGGRHPDRVALLAGLFEAP